MLVIVGMLKLKHLLVGLSVLDVLIDQPMIFNIIHLDLGKNQLHQGSLRRRFQHNKRSLMLKSKLLENNSKKTLKLLMLIWINFLMRIKKNLRLSLMKKMKLYSILMENNLNQTKSMLVFRPKLSMLVKKSLFPMLLNLLLVWEES